MAVPGLYISWADGAKGAKVWFAQAESQFAIKNITSELTK